MLGLDIERHRGHGLECRRVDDRHGIVGGVADRQLAQRRRDDDLMGDIADIDARDHRVGARIDHRDIGRRPVGNEEIMA